MKGSSLKITILKKGGITILRVSSAKTNITPREPSYLCGHAIRTRISTGVLDEIECTAMVLEAEEEKLIWVTYDLTILDRELTDEIRMRLRKIYHIPLEYITIAFVHTHAAPEVYPVSPFFEDEEHGARPGYRDFLIEKGLEAVRLCFQKSIIPVRAFGQTMMIEGFYGNRNGLDKVCDKSVNIVKLKDGSGRIAAGFVNLTCHPTVLGPQNLKISGDLFGYIKRGIAREWKVTPLMMQGAAGDMSNRCYRQGNDFNELVRTGEGILNQIFSKEKEEELEIDRIRVEPYHYHLEYEPDLALWRKELEEALEKLETERDSDRRKLLTSGTAILKLKLKMPQVTIDFDAAVLRLGDIEICTIPAELFSCFGLEIKKSSKAKMPVLWGYTNYSIGYLVEKSEYGKTFESMVSDIPAGEPERITSELCRLMAGDR